MIVNSGNCKLRSLIYNERMETTTVGQQVKQLRLQHDWSQEELAEMLDVTQGTISHIEQNRNAPSAQIARRLAAIFGVPVDVLIGNDLAMVHDS